MECQDCVSFDEKKLWCKEFNEGVLRYKTCERWTDKNSVANMPAGREMDSLISEKVMGWGNIRSGVWVGNPPSYMNNTGWRFGDHRDWEEIPCYSTDIKTAWSLIEKLGQMGYTGHIEWKGADREYAHTAEVVVNKSICMVGHAVGTAPLAICRAALMAVMGV